MNDSVVRLHSILPRVVAAVADPATRLEWADALGAAGLTDEALGAALAALWQFDLAGDASGIARASLTLGGLLVEAGRSDSAVAHLDRAHLLGADVAGGDAIRADAIRWLSRVLLDAVE